MYIKKECKKILIVFLFIFIILSSYQIILSQTGETGSTGTQPATTSGTTPESQTKSGAENPPEKGTVGNEKQDLGGLVGLENKDSGSSVTDTGTEGLVPIKPIPGTEPETSSSTTDSTPSLKGQNLDFERDLNAKVGEQKVKVTPNEKLGESKLELNGNEFSAKESNGELGKATFSIEKKEGEQFPETGGKEEGTKYTVKGGEKANGNAVDELAGREVELSKDTQVKITEDESGKRQVDLTVPEGGEIHQPGERKNGKEEEKKETDFRWFGNNLNWFDSQGNSHTINGELAWNQNLGFYVPGGKTSSIDGVNLFSGDNKGNKFNTQIFSDGKAHSEALGSYASFGENKLVTGSNNKVVLDNKGNNIGIPGPSIQFTQGNKYGVNIDSPKTDLVSMQANAGGQISLTNKASQSLSPNVQLSGNGGIINNGAKSYISDGQRFDFDRKLAGLSGYTSSPLEITPKGTNGNSLIGNNRYITNNFNQGAVVPNNYNFNTQGPYSYQGNSFDPRIGNNLINSPSSINNNPPLNPPPLTNPGQPSTNIPNQPTQPETGETSQAAVRNQQELTSSLNPTQKNNFNHLQPHEKNWVTNNLETLEKQQKFLDLNPNERSLFITQNLENQKRILESQNNIHDELGNLPDSHKYIGPPNLQFGQFPEVQGMNGVTNNFQAQGGTIQENHQFANAAEYYRDRLSTEFTGKPLPGPWSNKVLLRANSQPNIGPGGATSFQFNNGEVFGWNMQVQGSKERLMDSVIPHEVMHTIAATQFRKPLPRWIDEGVAQTVEHPSERLRMDRVLAETLQTGRGIEFNQMMGMQNYPRDILPLYAQGHSAAQYLIHIGGGGTQGRREIYRFMDDAMKNDDWAGALKNNYGLTPSQFQQDWLKDFVKNGYRSRGY